MSERAYSEFYSEHENSLRRFRINELLKQPKQFEAKRGVIERTPPSIYPSAIVGDVQLARRFSKNRQEFNLKGDRCMTTFVVPAGAPNRISGRNGQIYSTRVSEGRTVVDILPQDFESLLSGPLGKSWAKANPGLAVSLLAPEGVCSYSHDGAEFKVCDDGSVLVADHVATVLRCHGFRDAPSP